MSANTIDLTTIQSEVSDDLLKLKFDYGRRRFKESLLLKHYTKQKKLSDELFNQWHNEMNSQLLEEVRKFIELSLVPYGLASKSPAVQAHRSRETASKDADLLRRSLFPDTSSNLVHAAAVVLGMQAGDHRSTVNMIETHIGKELTTFKSVRVRAGLHKKTDVPSIMQQVRNIPRLVVIIEQTETIEPQLLGNLIRSLYNMLQEPTSEVVVVLFCMSRGSDAMHLILPLDATSSVGKIKTIVKESGDLVTASHEKLIQTGDIKFKLGPKLLDLIQNNFIQRDASITNIRYLYQFAMSEHFCKLESIFTLPQKDLAKLFKNRADLMSLVQKLPSLKGVKDLDVQWDSPESVASFCVRQIEDLMDYHHFIWNQISYYLRLLLDETGDTFPSKPIDIFEELTKHDNLSHSCPFVDSIANLHKYPVEAIIKRMDLAIKDHETLPKLVNDVEDVYYFFKNFKEKLENNLDCKEVVGQLVSSLHEHARVVKNPLRMPLCESLYHDDRVTVTFRALPSRVHYLEIKSKDPMFEVLFDLISRASEEISLADLFHEFKQAVSDIKAPRDRKNSEVFPSGKVLKVRLSTRRATQAPAPSIIKKQPEESDGLLKALFIDLMDCMQHHGFIESDLRKSKKGTVKRSMWL